MRKAKKVLIMVSLLISSTLFLGFRSDFFEVAKQLEIYTTLFKELNLYYIDEVNPAQLTESAINNMLNDLDPYTRYYDEQGVEEVKINSSGEFSGIGAESNFYDGKMVLTEVYEGYSAHDKGMRVGDRILKIGGVTIDQMGANEAHALLKGAAGTFVDLEVLRQGKTMSFTVEREKIEIDPVPHFQMIDPSVGYIAFDKFNSKASSSVKEAFAELKNQGMNKLILDLRGNPGGLLNEAIDITNFFVPKNEVVVSTKAKLQKWSEVYKTKFEPLDLDIPLVVLIDGKSASASEIVAGSLQDLDRAVILGERSFGKGLVQRYRNLTYGTKLKLTISKYYTPSGRNIQELDYTNREGENVPKFSDAKRNAFTTKRGRTVYDGGGIEPDISIDGKELSESAKALFLSDAIFNYATYYFYQHQTIASPETFSLSDSDFEQFMTFLEKEETNFSTKSERQFEKAFKQSSEEALSKGIQNSYNKLLEQLNQEKLAGVRQNKEAILEALTDEIINRYYYKKGEYQNHIAFSPFIKEAVELLNNQSKYNSILLNEDK